MKLKNEEIWVAREPLQELISMKLPVMPAYKLAKLASKLSEQLKIVEEVRQGLIKKYGEKDEKGQLSVKPEGENYEKFIEEFTELMAQENEIVIEKVKLPEKVTGTCDKCKANIDRPLEIEAKVLMALDKFIEVV